MLILIVLLTLFQGGAVMSYYVGIDLHSDNNFIGIIGARCRVPFMAQHFIRHRAPGVPHHQSIERTGRT